MEEVASCEADCQIGIGPPHPCTSQVITYCCRSSSYTGATSAPGDQCRHPERSFGGGAGGKGGRGGCCGGGALGGVGGLGGGGFLRNSTRVVRMGRGTVVKTVIHRLLVSRWSNVCAKTCAISQRSSCSQREEQRTSNGTEESSETVASIECDSSVNPEMTGSP